MSEETGKQALIVMLEERAGKLENVSVTHTVRLQQGDAIDMAAPLEQDRRTRLLRTLDALTGELNAAQQEIIWLKGVTVVELELAAEVDRLRALVREQEATIAALRAGAKMDAAPQEAEVAQLARCHRCRVDLYEDEYQCGARDMCESCCGCERDGEYI